ncbi:MAG TPA: hypothetical protein VLT36_21025, partial [Candidatus Dormibacteraeota bacterium]|nr:hypothetical protein [Candidatus Dormibacteraeota bacterium]
RQAKRSLRVVLLELLLYGVLVLGYFFLVIHFLADWLTHLFKDERRLYAAAALALIVGQGIVLEILTSALLSLVHREPEEE